MKKIILLSLFLTASLFAKGTLFSDAPAAKRVAPANNEVILSYYDSIKDVKHAVVNISTSKKIKVSRELEQFMEHPLFRQFFGDNMPKQNQQGRNRAHSLGSGVIVTENGYILTNNHVVADADEIFVTINGDNEEYKAKLIGTDPKTDIAVIKIKGKNFTTAQFADSSFVKEGDVVFALGNPFGVGSSVTKGIVSALNKSHVGINQYENFIQTDASINPGNSGGALVDSRGALIGINSAILSRSGGNNGIGFAIPSNMAKNIATRLINFGKIERGYLGVSISNLTKSLKSVYKNSLGAVIVDIVKGNSADLAGLKRGDLILSIDGKDIKGANELKNTIASYQPNTTIKVTYERAKKEHTISFVLGDQDAIGKGSGNFVKGLGVTNLDNTIREKLRIPSHISGVLVTDVKFNSNAEKFGFIENDIIVQIENFEVNTLKDIKLISKKLGKGAKRVYVNRYGYIVIIVIEN
ncbi:MAG TPA: Do family serine endopeptidase [Campylobacterales bacterium]|nr:Do family serine endopeptidase [Campylobacterales bacterium]